MPWDWNFVGELVVGVGGGMTVGSWLGAQAFRSVALEILAHPTTRKLASAAEKVAGKGGGLLEMVGKFFGGSGGAA